MASGDMDGTLPLSADNKLNIEETEVSTEGEKTESLSPCPTSEVESSLTQDDANVSESEDEEEDEYEPVSDDEIFDEDTFDLNELIDDIPGLGHLFATGDMLGKFLEYFEGAGAHTVMIRMMLTNAVKLGYNLGGRIGNQLVYCMESLERFYDRIVQFTRPN